MAVETILPADSGRAEDYHRVNPKDQPLKFLHPDGSVTDSQNVNVTASALPNGGATEAMQEALLDELKLLNSVDNQHPLPNASDSVYSQDIDTAHSVMGDFSGKPTDLFDDLYSLCTNSTATNPKILTIMFHRTVVSNVVGFGAASGNFSNIKVYIINAGGVKTLVVDESAVNTKYTTRTLQLPVTAGFNGLEIQFCTSDAVTISNCVILKAVDVIARLQGVLPTGATIDIGASTGGALKSSIEDGQTAKRVGVDALGQLKVVESVNLVGTSFIGATKDPNFWTESVVGSGAVVQDGEIFLNTGATANSTAKYISVRKARKIPGTVNQFRTVCRFITAAGANNIRRIGAYDALDGFFFELNGTTLNVVTRRTSGGITTDTPVASGSFNGNWGTTYTMDTIIKRMVIDMAEFSVQFYINDILLHSITASTLPLSSTYNLPVCFENINNNGNTTAHQLEVRFASIQRLGSIMTAGTSKYLGTNATYVLKYGAGILQKIVVTETVVLNTGTIVVYDNTAGSGTVLVSIDTVKVFGSLDLGIPYNIGLTFVVGGGAKCTVIYE